MDGTDPAALVQIAGIRTIRGSRVRRRLTAGRASPVPEDTAGSWSDLYCHSRSLGDATGCPGMFEEWAQESEGLP